MRPAVSNRFYDYCAMGASVYCNAVGAMKVVDEAATSLLDHIRVGRPRTFVDKTLIESKTDKGPDGSLTKTYYAFGEADDTIFSMNPATRGRPRFRPFRATSRPTRTPAPSTRACACCRWRAASATATSPGSRTRA